MKHFYIPLILFILIALEGVIAQNLPFIIWSPSSIYVLHLTFVFLTLVSIFYDEDHTYFSVVYALVFGLLIDIIYTDVLGVYMFSYALMIYIVHMLKKSFQENFYITIIINIVAISLADILINAIYLTIGKTTLMWEDYFILRLIPTLVVNLLFLISIYPFLQKRLKRWRKVT